MYKVMSYGKIAMLAVLGGGLLVLLKLMLRAVQRSAIIQGNELNDLILWSLFVFVTLCIQRSAAVRNNTVTAMREQESELLNNKKREDD